jgi:hypothetical protein
MHHVFLAKSTLCYMITVDSAFSRLIWDSKTSRQHMKVQWANKSIIKSMTIKSTELKSCIRYLFQCWNWQIGMSDNYRKLTSSLSYRYWSLDRSQLALQTNFEVEELINWIDYQLLSTQEARDNKDTIFILKNFFFFSNRKSLAISEQNGISSRCL